jgi:hypothetical protein
MKKFQLPEELGTEFSDPQIIAASKNGKSHDLTREERTFGGDFCDCYHDDPCIRYKECDTNCPCQKYDCLCVDNCKCEPYCTCNDKCNHDDCDHCYCVDD